MNLRGWCRWMKNHISIKDGFNFLNKSKIKAGDGLSEGDFPFYTSSSIQSKFLNDYEIEDESLIFGTGGSASIHYSKGKFSTSTDCFVIQSNNKYEIDLKYVYFYLFGNIHLLENGFKGAGLKHISKKYLEEIKIPLVPLETQKKIVEALDKAQALIDARKEQIRLMDELVKSRFVEMFGDPYLNPKRWKVSTLKKVAKRLSDGPFGSNLKSEHYCDCGVRVIRLQNIGTGIFIDKDKAYVSYKHYEKIKKYTCYPGDVLIGTLGEPNLRACILPDSIEKAINKADCVHYVPDENFINQEFICQYINSHEVMNFTADKIHGQTRSRISSGQVAQIPIYLPPIQLQNQFRNFKNQVKRSKLIIQNSLNELIITQQALMQQYFG